MNNADSVATNIFLDIFLFSFVFLPNSNALLQCIALCFLNSTEHFLSLFCACYFVLRNRLNVPSGEYFYLARVSF